MLGYILKSHLGFDPKIYTLWHHFQFFSVEISTWINKHDSEILMTSAGPIRLTTCDKDSAKGQSMESSQAKQELLGSSKQGIPLLHSEALAPLFAQVTKVL